MSISNLKKLCFVPHILEEPLKERNGIPYNAHSETQWDLMAAFATESL